MPPPLSILIRTGNCARELAWLAPRLDLLPGDQLIVVDSGSTDGTVALARKWAHPVIDLARDTYRPDRSLNAGFAAAKCSHVLVLSAHVRPLRPDFLAVHRAGLDAWPEDLACMAGPILWFVHQWRRQTGFTALGREEFRQGATLAIGNPNCVYPLAQWQAHPFVAADHCEDQYWFKHALEQGRRIGLLHAAAVLYRPGRPVAALFRKGIGDQLASAQVVNPPPVKLPSLLRLAARLGFELLAARLSPTVAARLLAYGCGHWLGSHRIARGRRSLST